MHICDMIKGNESDVTDIYFVIHIGKERVQIILLYIVFSVDELIITLETEIQFLWGLH